MPFTPRAVRPCTGTSVSAKRMARPSRDRSMTSAVPSERATARIRSPSCTPAAMRPVERGLENSSRAVRFTRPPWLTKTSTRSVSSRSSTGTIDTMRSPRSAPGNNEYTLCPRDARPLSGSSSTGRKWHCPSSVNARIHPWVRATKIPSIQSSS